jgi:hypothetical protein
MTMIAGRTKALVGGVTRGVGISVGLGGLTLAALVGSFFQWLMPAGIVGYVLAVPMALVAVAFSAFLLRAGDDLRTSGGAQEFDECEAVLEKAALARGGSLTVDEAAKILSVGRSEADQWLTRLVKERSDTWSLDIDPAGNLLFGLRKYRELSGPAASFSSASSSEAGGSAAVVRVDLREGSTSGRGTGEGDDVGPTAESLEGEAPDGRTERGARDAGQKDDR